MRSKLDEPGLFLLNGFFRWPDLEPLNPALTVVSSVLSPLLRRLCLVRRSLPLLFFTSEGPASLAIFFTMSQPAILTCTKAGHEGREGGHRFRLFLAEVAGEPFIADAMFKGR